MFRRFWLYFILCLLLITGWFFYASAAQGANTSDDSYKYSLLFARVVELIRQEYVDSGKVSYKDLTYAALRGMLTELDPHSQFLDEEAFAEMQKDTRGQFSGLGLVLGMKDNFLTVIACIEETPAARAGVLAGDRILKIDGKSTEKLSQQSATKKLRGQRGEKVRLTLMRPGIPGAPADIVEVDIIRDVIKVPTVREARILPDEMTTGDRIGYIRLEQFGEKTEDEMEKSLQLLEQQQMQALILDLRNNPGGLLDAAVEVAGKFLPPGQLIASTQGRQSSQALEYRARAQHRHPPFPMVVLINGYSASGAEIVAGALKDLKRAILIGETTFGKGSVQSVQDLGNGIGVRLTTAKYYTPSRKVIHEVGVEPDIAAPMSESEERLLLQLRTSRSTQPDKTTAKDIKDSQLDRAIIMLKSIRIYNARKTSPR